MVRFCHITYLRMYFTLDTLESDHNIQYEHTLRWMDIRVLISFCFQPNPPVI